MKNLYAGLCLALLISCKKEAPAAKNPENAPGPYPVAGKDTLKQDRPPQNEAEIRKEFADLNKKLLSKQLDSTGFTYECAENSGEAAFYYEGKQLRMVKSFTADSHFSSVTRYYLKNDEMFFILHEETVWSFDGGTPEQPLTKDNISQQRIYLRNGNPFKCLIKNFTIRSAGNNPDPEKIPNKEIRCDVKKLMQNYLAVLRNIDRKKTDCL